LARDETLILASTIVNYIPYGYMNVVPLIYLLEIGYSPGVIGLVYATGSIAATVGLVPFGILTDRYSRKRLLILAAAAPAISYAIFGLTRNQSWLVVASAIGGIGFGGGLASALQTPALYSRLAKGVAESRRATLIALVSASWIVAQGVGAILSYLPAFFQSALAQSFFGAHNVSFLTMAALALFSAIPLFFLTEEKMTTTEKSDLSARAEGPPEEVPALPKRTLASPKTMLLKFSVVFALAGIGVGMFVQLLPTWYNLKFGVSEGTAGLWIAMAQIPSVAAVPLIPLLVRRVGALFTSVATGFVATSFIVFMPLAGQFELVAVLFVGRSFFWSIAWPVLQSYLIGLTREEKRGTAVGVTYAAWSVANAAATLVGGYMFTMGLLQVPLVLATVALFGTTLALLTFFHRVRTAPTTVTH
jgi:MFS family permease